MKMFTNEQRNAAHLLQQDIPVASKPFEAISNQCNMTAPELMDFMKSLVQKGLVRKFGAILRHQKAGYKKNALIVWSVPENIIGDVGRLFSLLPFVSHCYERKPAFLNQYNLFTMVHSQEDNLNTLIQNMSRLIPQSDFLILESIQEYKKTSPEYFSYESNA